MTGKVKQYQAMTLLAGLLMTAGAGYCMDVMESERAGISRFDAGMDVKEMIQSREMEGMTLPAPEAVKAPFSAESPAGNAFAGLDECNIVNVKFVKQPALLEAVKMLQPCMRAVTKKYGVTVSASGYPMPKPNWHRPGTGIGILVSGKIPPGSPVLMDLRYTVEDLYSGSLLCHPARVEYLGEIVALAAGEKNVQDGVDAARKAIKKEIESEFKGVRSYSVVTGVQAEPAGRPGLFTFKAHEKIVGHGWEERYALTGTYDMNTGKVDYRSTKIWGTSPMWPRIAGK